MKNNTAANMKKWFKSFPIIVRLLMIVWGILCAFVTLGFLLTENKPASDIFVLLFFYGFTAVPLVVLPIAVSNSVKKSKQPKYESVENNDAVSNKSWGVTLLLSVFGGYLGIHRFYVGKYLTGILYLFTFGCFYIGWIIDIINVLRMRFTDKNKLTIVREKKNVESPNVICVKNDQTDDNLSESKQDTPLIQGEFSDNTTNDNIIYIKSTSYSEEKEGIDKTSEGQLYFDISLDGEDEVGLSIVPLKENEKDSTESGVQPKDSDTLDTILFGEYDIDYDTSRTRYYSNSDFLRDMRKYANKVGENAVFVPFFEYWPTYGSMNKAQQNWYFYWRTEVRNKQYPDTDASYVYIYVYELLNGYGWKSAEEGMELLMDVWLAYRERLPGLDDHLNEWVIDFALFNKLGGVPERYPACRPPYQLTYQDLIIDRYCNTSPLKLSFGAIEALSYHYIRGSKFYLNNHEQMMEEAIPRVIALADAYLIKKKGKGILALYAPNRTRKQVVYAYRGAVCKYANTSISLSVKAYTSSQRLKEYITAIVKYSENTLRTMYNHRGRLRDYEIDSELASLIERFLKKEYSPNTCQEEDTVNRHVTLDFENIDLIRSQSDAVREALAVPEEKEFELTQSDNINFTEIYAALSPDATEFLATIKNNGWKLDTSELFNTYIEEINRISEANIARSVIRIEGNTITIEEDFIDEINNAIINATNENISNDYSDDFSESDKFFELSALPDALRLFVEALSFTQLHVLWSVIALEDSSEQLEKIAEASMSMPEILIDEINEVASQYLDDIVIDTFDVSPCIFEQYKTDLQTAAK